MNAKHFKIGIELSTKASGLKDKGPIEEGKKEKRDEKGLVDFVEFIEFIVSIDFSLDLSSFLVSDSFYQNLSKILY